MMKAQDFIISTVEKLSEPINVMDIERGKLEEILYAKLMSKKYRKLKPGEKAVEITRKAISESVAKNKPIRIFEMFGGNKLWRFAEAPEIDWAELFSLTYFMQWCRTIASVYKPGVIFEYFSQDISVESLNNVPRVETDRYSESFRQLIKWIEPSLPSNLNIKYTRHFELFDDPSDYLKELEIAKQVVLKNNDGKLPVLTEQMKAATELNVKLLPGQDKDPLWREKVELQHQAIFLTKTLREYCDNPDIIWTCPTYYEDSIVTGSTKSSFAKFWAGVGALRPKGETFEELVLTPKQLESAEFDWEAVAINGLEGKNFKKVRLLK